MRSGRSRVPLGAQRTRRRQSPLQPHRDPHGRDDARELHDREDGRCPQVEQADRLVVDLGLDRRVPRAAEDEDDAERGEREEEDDRCGGGERGCEQRRGDLAEPGGRTGAERRRRLGHARIQVRPVRPHDPHHDGDVEERVGDQDRNPPALDAVGEDREERERHDHRREHERDDDERADQVASAESVATENVGRGERDEDRQRRSTRTPARR